MIAIVEAKPPSKPGNRITRAVAGLPPEPRLASINPADVMLRVEVAKLAIPAPDVRSDALDVGLDTRIDSPGFCLELDLSAWIEFSFDIEIVGIEFGTLRPPRSAGTTFARKRKIGRRFDGHRKGSDDIQARFAQNLLASLLPILLPPPLPMAPDELEFPSPLYAFQWDGIEWLLGHRPGALLGDDMGLGKTVQAIVAMRKLFREGELTRALVVCPKSVQTSWERHLADWAPELQVLSISGSAGERGIAWGALKSGQAHVGIATYNVVQRDAAAVKGPSFGASFGLVVADEIQKIKKASNKTSQAIRKIAASRRWGLSGTPIENDPDDARGVLTFLNGDLARAIPLPRRAPDEDRAAARRRLAKS